MKPALAVLICLLSFNHSAHAGWLDDLFGSSNKVQEKIDSIKETVNSTTTIETVKRTLSNDDIANGLKAALNKGAGFAVDSLGKPNGFLNNSAVKIAMPEKLAKIESLLRKTGQDKYADAFVTDLNRAAEAAVPLTRGVLKDGINNMTINDAKNILQGPDDSATQYLKKAGGDRLRSQILPIIEKSTARTGVTATYKKMYDKLGFAGKFLNLEDYNVDSYVTEKTMAGLFTMIAQEEKSIRENPAARTSDILKAVFGKN